MSTTFFSLVAAILYVCAGILIALQLSNRARAVGKLQLNGLAAVAVLGHFWPLSRALFTDQGINFGFFVSVSLLAWIIALLLVVTSVRKPVENLGIAIYPLAAAALVLQIAIPSEHYLEAHQKQLEIHILISIIAYGMLSIAALQAILLAIQDRHLHNRHPGGFVRALPPLQTMETLLFQMIGLGFLMQSFSLLSGVIFMEDIFAQHLVHKTVLSVLAWLVFGILLWGRWQFGWRGRVAIRWTLGGFVSLLLAYLGSKLVLELVLGYR